MVGPCLAHGMLLHAACGSRRPCMDVCASFCMWRGGAVDGTRISSGRGSVGADACLDGPAMRGPWNIALAFGDCTLCPMCTRSVTLCCVHKSSCVIRQSGQAGEWCSRHTRPHTTRASHTPLPAPPGPRLARCRSSVVAQRRTRTNAAWKTRTATGRARGADVLPRAAPPRAALSGTYSNSILYPHTHPGSLRSKKEECGQPGENGPQGARETLHHAQTERNTRAPP